MILKVRDLAVCMIYAHTDNSVFIERELHKTLTAYIPLRVQHKYKSPLGYRRYEQVIEYRCVGSTKMFRMKLIDETICTNHAELHDIILIQEPEII